MSNDEREQTLNQLLIEMDGFDSAKGVIVMAATNRASVLDPAVTRPGRFDRHIHIGLPDGASRKEILQVIYSWNSLIEAFIDPFKEMQA